VKKKKGLTGHEEMRAKAESRREESKAFHEMMLFMMFEGEKKQDKNND
jgi:hypothetical protein